VDIELDSQAYFNLIIMIGEGSCSGFRLDCAEGRGVLCEGQDTDFTPEAVGMKEGRKGGKMR